MIYRRLVRPVLFRAYGGDAERVHDKTLASLRVLGRVAPLRGATRALLARGRRPVEVAGIDFPGAVGVAAGLDKNGVAVRTFTPCRRSIDAVPTVARISKPRSASRFTGKIMCRLSTLAIETNTRPDVGSEP